jgi:ferric-dicitrate binding protein FerR (iron transport regulator)
MTEEQVRQLLEKYRLGQCSPGEIVQLEQWMDTMAASARWDWTPVEKKQFEKKLRDEIQNSTGVDLPGKEAKITTFRLRRLHWGWVAAAVVFLLAGTTGYLFYTGNQKDNTSAAPALVAQHDIQPGGNKAVLILADGSAITLDSSANGKLASQGNVTIIKTDEGQLQYQGRDELISWNTLRTPKGGQFKVTLPDGTKVWLNAASSITYPTSFTGNERTVEMSGEAYFEVVHNDKMPFRVKARGLIIRDLGTAFNVNTYPDETSSKVTLLEGSAEVTAGGQSKLLVPGEQTVVKEERFIGFGKADTEEAIAWKKGYFHFKQTDLPAMIRQLQRWYNIDVQYTGAVPTRSFSGKITRDLALSQVIAILADMEVRFRIEGNTLIVGH